MDAEPVELSNLHRQVIYTSRDIGQPKVEAAARYLIEINPALTIQKLVCDLNEDNAAQMIRGYDFIIDATDSPAAKFLINDTAIETGTPFVYAGVLGMSGQVMTVIPRRSACLRCVFEEAPDATEIASCREAGIIGSVAGAIGGIQAREAIATVVRNAPRLAGEILTYDAAASPRVRISRINPRRGCICGAYKATATEVQAQAR
jgi:molybdopterin/thiamine biosynthesis adenylyltransferase